MLWYADWRTLLTQALPLRAWGSMFLGFGPAHPPRLLLLVLFLFLLLLRLLLSLAPPRPLGLAQGWDDLNTSH